MNDLEETSPFQDAVDRNDIETVKALLPTIEFDEIQLALKQSMLQDNVDLFQILFEKCIEDKEPITPIVLLGMASKYEKIGVLKYLMNNVSQKEMEDQNMLDFACSNGTVESVKVLLTQLCPRHSNCYSLRMATGLKDQTIRRQMVELLLPFIDPTSLDHELLKNCIRISDNYLVHKVLKSIENYPIDREFLRVACISGNQEMVRYFYEKLPEDDIRYVSNYLNNWCKGSDFKNVFFIDQWIGAEAQKKRLLRAIENDNDQPKIAKRKM